MYCDVHDRQQLAPSGMITMGTTLANSLYDYSSSNVIMALNYELHLAPFPAQWLAVKKVRERRKVRRELAETGC